MRWPTDKTFLARAVLNFRIKSRSGLILCLVVRMRIGRKALVTAIVLAFISLYLTLYTIMVHTIAARHICEDPDGNAVAWRTGPSGSLFPWPREPGMLEILSKINEVDLFIYRYLIKPWVLVGLSILAWVGTGLFIFRTSKIARAI